MENSKLKNSRKNSKLKNSAFFRPLHAEKMAKKPACFIIPPLALFRTCLCVKTPIRRDSELIIEDNYRFSNWSCVLRKKNSPRHLEDPECEMDISARQLSKFDTFGFCSVVLIFKATSTSLREKKRSPVVGDSSRDGKSEKTLRHCLWHLFDE